MAFQRLVSEWNKLKPFLSLLDFGERPATKVAWWVRASVVAFALVTSYRRADATIAPLLAVKPPTPIPSEEIEDYKFRLPERTRREIFEQIAVAEVAERKRAIEQNTWQGHLWSREDDRGHFERTELRALAMRYRLSLSQMYLVLDEGIREHWPGPDAQPLPGTTPPLNPRTTW